jgi:hypothetical protein
MKKLHRVGDDLEWNFKKKIDFFGRRGAHLGMPIFLKVKKLNEKNMKF